MMYTFCERFFLQDRMFIGFPVGTIGGKIRINCLPLVKSLLIRDVATFPVPWHVCTSFFGEFRHELGAILWMNGMICGVQARIEGNFVDEWHDLRGAGTK